MSLLEKVKVLDRLDSLISTAAVGRLYSVKETFRYFKKREGDMRRVLHQMQQFLA
jgi:hypothetical protein